MNNRKKAVHVGTVVLETVKGHLWLSFTILAVVAVHLRLVLRQIGVLPAVLQVRLLVTAANPTSNATLKTLLQPVTTVRKNGQKTS